MYKYIKRKRKELQEYRKKLLLIVKKKKRNKNKKVITSYHHLHFYMFCPRLRCEERGVVTGEPIFYVSYFFCYIFKMPVL